MSRIFRYQDSFRKFIKTKSCIAKIDVDISGKEIQNKLFSMIDSSNNVVGILLLTILNNQGKKTKMNVLHGYHIASGLELLLCATMMVDYKKEYYTKFGKNIVNDILNRICSYVNISLLNNIELLQDTYTSVNYGKLIKIIYTLVKIVNSKIHKILHMPTFEYEGFITKTDTIKYKFNDMNEAKNKIKKLKKIKKDNLDSFVSDTYGVVGQLVLINGWILGGGDDKIIPQLEKMGTQFGYILKTVQDFLNIENDLDNAKIHSKNTIINNGFQISFETFIENKHKFIEGCIRYNMYTNTVKEIIDLLEINLDTIIDKSSPDVRSHFTLSNENSIINLEKNGIININKTKLNQIDNENDYDSEFDEL